MKKKPSLMLFFLPLLLVSCLAPTKSMSPHLDFSVQDKYIKSLPLSFAPLTEEERREPWGHEAYIGHLFAQELDLYAAITALKRAHLLLPQENLSRKKEIEYGILYCYYLGKKYPEVVASFEESSLAQANSSFPVFHDLLVILCEAYMKTKDLERASWMLQTLSKFYPDTAKKMALSIALSRGDLETLVVLGSANEAQAELLALQLPPEEPENSISPVQYKEESSTKMIALEEYVAAQDALNHLTSAFQKERKHPKMASFLNALLPGAGYLYLGQKQSAFTSFCINSLFISAAYYFYHEKNLPAAIITTGFEMGWYFGGIIGSGEAAILYNERLYEAKAHPTLRTHKLYPLLQLHYGF